MRMPRSVLATVTALTVAAALAGPVSAAHLTPLVGLTVDDRLVRFTPSTACEPTPAVRVSGLQPGESLLAIDERPATGQLYGLGSSSRVYVVDAATGVATQVGSGPFSPLLSGSAFGFDFNPTVDRIRIVSDTGQNLRAHPETGAVVSQDATLRFAAGDVHAGAQPGIVGAAYTNPDVDPLTGTVLYDLSGSLDLLATQAPPNDGILNRVGGTVRTNALTGFDIAPSGAAFVVTKSVAGGGGCGPSTLSQVDLTTGATTMTWSVGTPTPLRGLAVDLS